MYNYVRLYCMYDVCLCQYMYICLSVGCVCRVYVSTLCVCVRERRRVLGLPAAGMGWVKSGTFPNKGLSASGPCWISEVRHR